MKISVLIPAYNAERFVAAAIESVLNQSLAPDEILALDDGSNDATREILNSFGSKVIVLHQQNRGVACARNKLCQHARGDLLAFLDADDLWHPKYLEAQVHLMEKFPEALATYVGHVDFAGENYLWDSKQGIDLTDAEYLDQVQFFKRYNTKTGDFGSASFSCIRSAAIKKMGSEPYRFGGVEDSFAAYRISLMGGVAMTKFPLVAYRVHQNSLSANRLRMMPLWVSAFEALESDFKASRCFGLRSAFPIAYAAKRRHYAKHLLGASRRSEARYQLLQSMLICKTPSSIAKSVLIWMMSWLPSGLQPKWPSVERPDIR